MRTLHCRPLLPWLCHSFPCRRPHPTPTCEPSFAFEPGSTKPSLITTKAANIGHGYRSKTLCSDGRSEPSPGSDVFIFPSCFCQVPGIFVNGLRWGSQDSAQAVSPGPGLSAFCAALSWPQNFCLPILPASTSSQKSFIPLTNSHGALSVFLLWALPVLTSYYQYCGK